MNNADDVVTDELVPHDVQASTSPVAVFAVGRARTGKEKDFEKLLDKVVPLIRQEPGCEQYVVHASREEPGVYSIYERFRSGADLLRHLQEPFVQAYLGAAAELLDGRLEARWMTPLSV
jgi:quinol monooxygenase YgiN